MFGRIYIIKSSQTDKVYIGSTVETLNKRFREHKCSKTCTSREILKYDDAEIILLECYDCETYEELRKKEGEYIKQYNCVNKLIAGRTKTEYYEDNKEKIKEYRKEYRQENKEKLNEKITCECGGKYTHKHKSTHFKTKKHIEFLTYLKLI